MTPGPGTLPLVFNPYDYAVHDDPYPVYARLREEAPCYHNQELGFFALSRHEDVQAAFRDVERFSNRNGVSIDPAAWGPQAASHMSFLAMDPPRHTRMRSLVGKGFTPRRVAELEEGIRSLTRHHLAPALEAGTFDLISEVAGRIPMDVISELLGVPEADRAELRRLADLVMHREEGIDDVPPAGLEAALALAVYYQELLDDRRARPRDDLTSALLEAEVDGDRLSGDDIAGFLFLMVVAGNETTTKLLGNAWYWGWRFGGRGRLALQDPARVPEWVEETLRYDNSTQLLARLTNAPLERHGVTVPAGSQVLLLIGAANRDPRVFDDPDDYRLGRDTTKSLSFGGGRHFCMGAALARLEGRIVLEELAATVADYEVDEDGAERVHSVNVRGFARLPTTVTRR